jgi:multicomponent K+:H+ antiporter subunit E
MKHWLPHPLLTPILALVWLLLNNTWALGHVLLGLLLGWAIPRFTLAYWPDQVRIYRPFSLLRFAGVFLFDVLVANVAVARLVLAGPKALNPLFVWVPLDLTHELGLSLLANTICLTPGTVSARLSSDQRYLLVHALDCTDPDGLIRTIKARFEAPLMEIFEC